MTSKGNGRIYTLGEIERNAVIIFESMSEQGVSITLEQALESSAAIAGFRSWEIAVATATPKPEVRVVYSEGDFDSYANGDMRVLIESFNGSPLCNATYPPKITDKLIDSGMAPSALVVEDISNAATYPYINYGRVFSIAAYAYKSGAGGGYGDKKNMTSKKASIADFISKFAAYKTDEVVAIREPAVIESYSIDAASGKCTIKYLYKADEDYERRVPESMELPARFIDEINGAPTSWVQKRMGGVPNGCITEMLRTFVRIVNIRLEKLDEISYDDAKAEGIEIVKYLNPDTKLNPMYKNYDQRRKRFTYHNPIGSFCSLWESIGGKGSFDDRYVFVYEYAYMSKEEVSI